MPTVARLRCVLTIAGSDPTGGAGIQADLKTFAAHGVHGLSAIAALTAQNSRGVAAVHVPPPSFLGEQIDACFADFNVGAVKIGMLANANSIRVVADALERHRPKHIVLDPVMAASSGGRLLALSAMQALRSRLIPLASVITPNIPEAQQLLGHPIVNVDDAETALVELLALGARAVLLKGGHLPGSEVIDRLDDGRRLYEFVHPRLDIDGRGTGCTLASAIASNLCLGSELPEACERAADYVHGALTHAYQPGKGKSAVLDHFWKP